MRLSVGVVVVFALGVLQMAEFVKGDGQYTIVGPGTIHSERDYNVAVAVHHTTEPVELKIGITGPSHNESQTVKITKPDELHQLNFKLPELKDGDYNLTAEGVSGLIFKNTTKLNLEKFKPYIKLQTDKSKYKPGDIINFRVLFLDENLKPTKPHGEAVIYIEDQKRNRIKELKDFQSSTRQGVYTGKFELSEFAPVGSWSMQIQNGGSYPDTRVYFDVEKYVLPKYSVKMEATENVAVQDGDMQVIVRANYTYGKPVNGKVLLLLELDPSTIYSNVDGVDKTEEKPGHSLVQTADMINGKAKFDLNLREFEPFLPYKTSSSYIRITSTVEEDFTGVKLNETGGTQLYPYRYHMNCHDYQNCYQFHADKEQQVSFKITYIDGTEVKDTKSVVRAVYTEGIRYNYGWHRHNEEKPELPKIDNKTFTFESHLNESGIAVFKVLLPDLPDIENFTRYYEIELEYAGEKRQLFTTYPYREPKHVEPTEEEVEKEYFRINVEKQGDSYYLKLNEPAIFTLNSSAPLKYFVYNIVGRGNILHSERVELEEPKNVYNLTVKTSFLMAPYGRIYAYYIDEKGEFRYAETSFNIEVVLQNQINITAPEEVKPGADVTLKIKTEPKSFVGLTAIDQSVLLLGGGGNDISSDDFRWRLGGYDTHTPWQGGYSYYPGERTGVVTLTNGNFFYNRTQPEYHITAFSGDVQSVRKMGAVQFEQAAAPHGLGGVGVAAIGGSAGGAVAVRKNFVETWIFADIENTETEVFEWTKTVPDTITSWVLTAFAVHPEKGLGVLSDKVNIKTFQPFFISVRLPYAVKRGEVINVPALVSNYLTKDLDVQVTLDNSDGEYEFVDTSNEIISDPKRTQTVRVAANEAAGVSFIIRPKIIGNIMLKLLAVSPIAGDAIHKTLKVIPEGVTQYANRAYFVNLKQAPEGVINEQFELELPAEVVPDSQHIEIAVVGDLLGPVVKNLEELIRLPSGCGEQTMSKLVPNYLVYEYLKSIQRLTPTLETRIKRNLEQGYQNILNYRHDDGSFSSFGPGKWHADDKPRNGSTWLTAYVLRSLRQISGHIKVDEKMLQTGYDFLLSKQADNGSFLENGEYFYGSQRNELTLTSSVLLALQSHKEPPKTQIDKAVKFLVENLDKNNDMLPQAIATYALQQSQPDAVIDHVAKLKSKAQSEDGRTWWSNSEERKKGVGLCARWWCWVFSNDVEITSYALLTLLEHETPEQVLSIISWLVAQRNNYGGFGSSQDTVVGLTALIRFAQKAGYEAALLDVDVQSHGASEKSEVIKVTEDNGLLMQTVELPQGTKSIDFTAKGTGAALVQISYQYNIVEKEPKPSFKLETVLKPNVAAHKLELDVCVEFVEEETKASNMAILEISLPSGYTADEDSFEQIRTIDRVRLVETKNADSVIVVYFESLPKGETKCVPIEAYKTFSVALQKPASIVLYDYYDTNKKATDYYQIDSKFCDLCEDNECKSKC